MCFGEDPVEHPNAMTEDSIRNVDELDWTSREDLPMPTDVRVVLVVAGRPVDALTRQRTVVASALEQGFTVVKVAAKRAQQAREIHRMETGLEQPSGPTTPPMSALELTLRHPDEPAATANAVEAFVETLDEGIDLHSVRVGNGGDHGDYYGDVVVMN